jgi:hypothetical protein
LDIVGLPEVAATVTRRTDIDKSGIRGDIDAERDERGGVVDGLAAAQ